MKKAWHFWKTWNMLLIQWQKVWKSGANSRNSRARFSHVFHFFVKICHIVILFQSPSQSCQIFILFYSPSQNLPDFLKIGFQRPFHLVTPKLLILLIFIDLGNFYWFQGAHSKIYWFQPPTAVGAHRRLKMLISYQYFCTKSIKIDLKSMILVAPMAKILIWGCTRWAPMAVNCLKALKINGFGLWAAEINKNCPNQ